MSGGQDLESSRLGSRSGWDGGRSAGGELAITARRGDRGVPTAHALRPSGWPRRAPGIRRSPRRTWRRRGAAIGAVVAATTGSGGDGGGGSARGRGTGLGRRRIRAGSACGRRGAASESWANSSSDATISGDQAIPDRLFPARSLWNFCSYESSRNMSGRHDGE